MYTIMYLVNPVFEERENQRLLNEQIDRKKNIKKLEQLFLEQTARITNQIYSWFDTIINFQKVSSSSPTDLMVLFIPSDSLTNLDSDKFSSFFYSSIVFLLGFWGKDYEVIWIDSGII